jgi:hypothetical protein
MATNPNIIQIKRSNSTATPTSLNVGELAWSNVSGQLFINAFGTITAIGGTRTPGVLTANQALVANNTGYLNAVKTANLTVTSITANGVYNPGAGYLLSVDSSGKTFWVDPGALTVGPEYVTNTDSRTLSGNLYFTGANVTINNLNIGSGVISGNGAGLTSVDAATLGGSSLQGVYDTANSYAYTAAGSAFANAVSLASGYAASAFANAYNKATSYADGVAASAFANAYNKATSYADSVAASAFANAIVYAQNAYANATNWAGNYADMKAGDAYSNATAWAGNYADMVAGYAYSNATAWAYNNLVNSVSNGDNSITIGGTATNPTISVQIASGNGIHVGTSGLYIGQNVETTADVTFNTGNFNSIVSNTSIIGNTATIYHDLVVGGSIIVTGNVISTNVETISVTDTLIKLGTNNSISDVLDIGFYGEYNNGSGVVYSGLVRDASDKVFKLFKDLTVDPISSVLNFSDSTEATLQAYLQSGGLTSNGTNINITANNTLAVSIVANTLTLSTALASSSGGTGYDTYNDGDLLYGSGGSLTTLSSGSTGGYILQTDGAGHLSWNSLDGGTF